MTREQVISLVQHLITFLRKGYKLDDTKIKAFIAAEVGHIKEFKAKTDETILDTEVTHLDNPFQLAVMPELDEHLKDRILRLAKITPEEAFEIVKKDAMYLFKFPNLHGLSLYYQRLSLKWLAARAIKAYEIDQSKLSPLIQNSIQHTFTFYPIPKNPNPAARNELMVWSFRLLFASLSLEEEPSDMEKHRFEMQDILVRLAFLTEGLMAFKILNEVLTLYPQAIRHKDWGKGLGYNREQLSPLPQRDWQEYHWHIARVYAQHYPPILLPPQPLSQRYENFHRVVTFRTQTMRVPNYTNPQVVSFPVPGFTKPLEDWWEDNKVYLEISFFYKALQLSVEKPSPAQPWNDVVFFLVRKIGVIDLRHLETIINALRNVGLPKRIMVELFNRRIVSTECFSRKKEQEIKAIMLMAALASSSSIAEICRVLSIAEATGFDLIALNNNICFETISLSNEEDFLPLIKKTSALMGAAETGNPEVLKFLFSLGLKMGEVRLRYMQPTAKRFRQVHYRATLYDLIYHTYIAHNLGLYYIYHRHPDSASFIRTKNIVIALLDALFSEAELDEASFSNFGKNFLSQTSYRATPEFPTSTKVSQAQPRVLSKKSLYEEYACLTTFEHAEALMAQIPLTNEDIIDLFRRSNTGAKPAFIKVLDPGLYAVLMLDLDILRHSEVSSTKLSSELGEKACWMYINREIPCQKIMDDFLPEKLITQYQKFFTDGNIKHIKEHGYRPNTVLSYILNHYTHPDFREQAHNFLKYMLLHSEDLESSLLNSMLFQLALLEPYVSLTAITELLSIVLQKNPERFNELLRYLDLQLSTQHIHSIFITELLLIVFFLLKAKYGNALSIDHIPRLRSTLSFNRNLIIDNLIKILIYFKICPHEYGRRLEEKFSDQLRFYFFSGGFITTIRVNLDVFELSIIESNTSRLKNIAKQDKNSLIGKLYRSYAEVITSGDKTNQQYKILLSAMRHAYQRNEQHAELMFQYLLTIFPSLKEEIENIKLPLTHKQISAEGLKHSGSDDSSATSSSSSSSSSSSTIQTLILLSTHTSPGRVAPTISAEEQSRQEKRPREGFTSDLTVASTKQPAPKRQQTSGDSSSSTASTPSADKRIEQKKRPQSEDYCDPAYAPESQDAPKRHKTSGADLLAGSTLFQRPQPEIVPTLDDEQESSSYLPACDKSAAP